jgi:hypothetical protein
MKKNFIIIILLTGLFSAVAAQQRESLIYSFPLPRPHTGIIIGNGTQGLMIWGQDSLLNITIGHNGFWDHRGKNELKNLTTFKDFKERIYRGDKTVTRMFSGETNEGIHRQIGGGNLEIKFPSGYILKKGILDINTATATIYLSGHDSTEVYITIRQLIKPAAELQIAWLNIPKNLVPEITLQPSWNWIGSTLKKAGITAPEEWKTKINIKGFTQTLPEDAPLNIGYRYIMEEGKLLIGSYLGEISNTEFDKKLTESTLRQGMNETNKWWKEYWTAVPSFKLPDPVIQEIVDMGLYKQACVTPPQAKGAGLQGPFLEHHQLPPWGGDFHFNINVEMIYEPALASNRPDHFNPLWDIILTALPTMKANGKKFYENDKALFFTHATDDQGNTRGGFWSGIMDQANAAWMATLAWKHYRYTMDENILSEIGWPLLEGSFEAYYATLEEVDDGNNGKRFSLPFTVSPEYGGNNINYCWGRDASFQLAALHSVANILPKAAKILGKPIDSRWEEVSKRLPQYTVVDNVYYPETQLKGKRIGLWEGRDLEGSHRHHSHLAGIYPFCTIDPHDPSQFVILTNTLDNFIFKGPGNWVGWSFPWASTICSRVGNIDAAIKWLHIWEDNMVNESRASLAFSNLPTISRSADFRFSPTSKGGFPWERARKSKSLERMQMDASMAALTAVFELFVQNKKDDILDVLPYIPSGWKDFSFSGILTEGAFLVSANVKNGEIQNIQIKSTKGGLLKLKNNMGKSYKLNGRIITNAPLIGEYNTQKEEVVIFEKL